MRFSEYFQDWLYGESGYYSNYKTIGKEGDFYTAVSTSAFFGGSIGKRIVDVIESGYLPKDSYIVEIGAHHGYLLADIIQFIYTLKPELLNSLKFGIVERFDFLQEKQKEYFQQSFGDVIELVHFDDICKVKLDNAIVVANEIFDAFPCELIYTNGEKLQIATAENHNIEFEDCKDGDIIAKCTKYGITKGELAVGYEQFAKELSQNIGKFEFITFDYGEKYARNDFSCRIYEKHNVYPIFQGRVQSVSATATDTQAEDEKIDLEKLFGTSDITYDVNFSHLIDCFDEVGVKCERYDTQLKALVDFGIIELLEILHKNVDENTYLKEANKVKTLLEPTGMGDRFKIAIFRKG